MSANWTLHRTALNFSNLTNKHNQKLDILLELVITHIAGTNITRFVNGCKQVSIFIHYVIIVTHYAQQKAQIIV